MPLAPPVTIATRPSRRAMLFFPRHAPGEFLEAGQLRLDHVDGRLIGERESLFVEFLRRKIDEDLRLAEQARLERGERHAQVILHARSAEQSSRARLQRHRLVLERHFFYAGDPLDRLLWFARGVSN